MGRRTLNLRLLQSEGKEKAESLHVHNDHIDKLLHDIVSKHLNHIYRRILAWESGLKLKPSLSFR